MQGDTILAGYVPLILTLCQEPQAYACAELQAAAVLTLAKFMTVSASFCEEHLQLMFSVRQRPDA